MPKKSDDTLKTAGGLYKSRIDASKKYDTEKVDNIRLRVPKGWKELMQEHVKDKANSYTSVNGMICDLIKKELDL